ncbi:uncharacterized protein N7469_005624 [Penicillium citrinum]|uniref:Altered inheritance of mitochondria protein 11 n=2 Tax=Penicillium TaxID=5073 RepID=A0A9W9TPU0_PENCI|nr:uncharacterized protein N7469_005624 [Penicillium citrinum]KAJ5233858.1 hypothetical protein N7469_005624 [Penicillium citrinum]KAJ5572675.1 hypothetical protein N7450_009659 [Penicillium hetheringtonii]KAK5790153.1 hypothetical protein VI817_007440 [Penicillium citrinum]
MLSFLGWGSGSKPDASHSSENKSIPSKTDQNLPPSIPTPSEPSTQIARSTAQDRTNLKLFVGGMAFFAFSVLITRRAHHKKRIASIPPYYTSSVYYQPKYNGAMEAFEALNLATINVISFGMMATGGIMCMLNVNGIEDMRRIMRGGLEGAAAGKSDDELEKEVTDWVASVFGDRFEKQLEIERAKKREQEGKTN